MLLCVVLASLCEILAVPAHQARVTGLAPEGSVARYAGLSGLAQGIAQTCGPIVGGCLIEWASPRIGWVLLALFGLVAAGGFRRSQALVPMPKDAVTMGRRPLGVAEDVTTTSE